MHSLIEIENERLAWSLKTFPKATVLGSLKKLRSEIDEIEYDVQNGERRPEEYADALMCLFDAAGRNGITIEQIIEAYRKKFVVNKDRIWRDNGDGSYSHEKNGDSAIGELGYNMAELNVKEQMNHIKSLKEKKENSVVDGDVPSFESFESAFRQLAKYKSVLAGLKKV